MNERNGDSPLIESIEKGFADRAARLSAQTVTLQPFPSGALPAGAILPGEGGWTGSFLLQIGAVADGMIAWGVAPQSRDRQLRAFWPTESWLASTIFAMCGRNAAFEWKISGPPQTAAAATRLLTSANFGQGWEHFFLQVSVDLYTQDNGAFVETIRAGPLPTDPVVGIAHLDSGRCVRTGDLEYPVVYTDRRGKYHRLGWWQVVPIVEMPSAIETLNGIGFCAVSRVLRAAQILRDVAIHKAEKIAGRFNKAIYFVSGPSTQNIEDALAKQAIRSDDAGVLRYQQPLVVGTIDPTRPVTIAKIELASLPDGWDEDKTIKWYLTNLALGFGADYQDLAPLPGGNLGTAAQSETLARKSAGKGPALIQQIVEQLINENGIIPSSCEFSFIEDDLFEQQQVAQVRKLRAEARAIRLKAGEIDSRAARELAVADGDLSEAQAARLDADEVSAPAPAPSQMGPGSDGTNPGETDSLPDGVAPTPNPDQTGPQPGQPARAKEEGDGPHLA